MPDNFSDAALVLISHGAEDRAGSEEPTATHAAALRGRGLFAQVLEAFLKQAPGLDEALQAAVAPRVFVVPLFSCEGYFTQQVLPRRLGLSAPAGAGAARVVRRGTQTLYYCYPVGTHQRMQQVVLARVQEVLSQFPVEPPLALAQVTLCIVGHGTARDPNSRLAVHQVAAQIAALNQFAAVHAVYLEEEPRVTDCYRLARTRDIVVVPFFISAGEHVWYDIPVWLGEEPEVVKARHRARQSTWQNPTQRHGKRLWYARSVGTDPALVEVILDRVQEAAGWAAG